MTQRTFFDIDDRLLTLAEETESDIRPAFEKIESIAFQNQQKVLAAFIHNHVGENCFTSSTGYGYGDTGREKLEKVFADAMECEDALLRHNFMCGTHALTVALFGVLRPGDTMLCVTGMPYDTIQSVIGLHNPPASGSLKEFGIGFQKIDLLTGGGVDIEKMRRQLRDDASIKMVYIQRSRGYSLRPSLPVEAIGEICAAAHEVKPEVVVMVDNCYGEFVQLTEPCVHGADLMAGSLIKNPGGGIASTGGYIAGRKDLVEMCSYRLSTPGTGREVGCTLGHSREMYMGLFSAPHVVGEALKTAVFAAGLFTRLGYDVTPRPDESRADIIQSLLLRTPEALIAFCQGIQSGSPVDAQALPEPWDMPGYDSKIIMASGSFTLGSSIELSADAPLREPYAVWMQGALNYAAGKTGVLIAADRLLKQSQKH
ncbi:MAG: methionine gamma-lyase family protein [Clostridia bacterium]|nr:methionine gamma-lyase family protein [Clostridia bacterium]MBQ1554173.1 methionine gamma-lyase family protein [Clostridia bacterium]